MEELSSLSSFTNSIQFIDVNDPEQLTKLESEFNKLAYLQSYPRVVRAKIRSKKTEIASLETGLYADINSQTSDLARIKRRQELQDKFDELTSLKEQLKVFNEEYNYAIHVKQLATTKIEMYNKLLSKEGSEVAE